MDSEAREDTAGDSLSLQQFFEDTTHSLTLEFELNMNETFNTSFILNQAPNFNILAVKEWHAYCLIFIYVVVIIFSSFGSILVIAAVIRTKSNIFIGQI